MTLEEYQSMSDDARLDYAVSHALATMATADAVIVTDADGVHWEVTPQELFRNDDGDASHQASGFAEDRSPFDDD